MNIQLNISQKKVIKIQKVELVRLCVCVNETAKYALTFLGFCLMLKPFWDLTRRNPVRRQSELASDMIVVFFQSFLIRFRSTLFNTKNY